MNPLPVSDSQEFRRIDALLRRTPPSDTRGLVVGLTALLRKPAPAGHVCTRDCITELLPVQAWALFELSQVGGLFAPIGVGCGKTGLDILAPMVVPGCRTALLLLPANLRDQFRHDYERWSVHFRVPTLAGGTVFYTDGRPVLHVMSYSELSVSRSAAVLDRIKPDLILADEMHRLRHLKGAGAGRVAKDRAARPAARFAGWSGTITSHGILDFVHLAAWSLRQGSPVPLDRHVAEEWASAVDPGDEPSPAGVLAQWGGTAREGFQRRMAETRGVVTTGESTLGTSLVITPRRPVVPPAVQVALDAVRDWERPDHEEAFAEPAARARCASQVASGFFYRWRWPRGESRSVVEQWLYARGRWHRELRDELDDSRAHLDSPLLLWRAAERWANGYEFRGRQIPPRTRWCGQSVPETGPFDVAGPLPTWDSETWREWRDVRDSAQPETEAVWLSDFLVVDAVEWARESPGVVWYQHDALGRELARVSGLPLYGGGDEASAGIATETGGRSIIASVRAHGTGKNLQRFSRNLVCNPSPDGAAWEQLLGRTHRLGQAADEVTFDVYQHTGGLREALAGARELATYIEETVGTKQRLCYAGWAVNP